MLTAEQKLVVKAAILADPELAAQPLNSDGAFAIADALNQVAAPAFIVWRTSVMLDEVSQSDTFNWTEVDGLSVGKARIWEWLFDNSSQSMNPSKANVRAGIINCWSGNAARLVVQAAILDISKRAATRAEKILATGTGTTASPAVMGFEGPLSYSDVQDARAS